MANCNWKQTTKTIVSKIAKLVFLKYWNNIVTWSKHRENDLWRSSYYKIDCEGSSPFEFHNKYCMCLFSLYCRLFDCWCLWVPKHSPISNSFVCITGNQMCNALCCPLISSTYYAKWTLCWLERVVAIDVELMKRVFVSTVCNVPCQTDKFWETDLRFSPLDYCTSLPIRLGTVL